eukprot:scpid98451/ scgid11846/ 
MFVVFLYAVIRSQHEVMRRKAIESTLKSANSMARYYNRKKRVQVEDFRVGDAVAVVVPKLDRAGTNVPPRLAGVVHSIHGTECRTYSVAIAFGILATRFSGGRSAGLLGGGENQHFKKSKPPRS